MNIFLLISIILNVLLMLTCFVKEECKKNDEIEIESLKKNNQSLRKQNSFLHQRCFDYLTEIQEIKKESIDEDKQKEMDLIYKVLQDD